MKYYLKSLVFLALFSSSLFGQVVINEIQSSNLTTVQDEFGKFPDWIELKNVSASEVNLNNWYLSDDASSIKKWFFPEIIIQPNSHLLIYASGRDIKQQPISWNTLIDIGDDWSYIVPTEEITDWNDQGFDDSSWQVGSSGFGYDNNDGNIDDSTVVPNTTVSLYMRHSFSIENASEVSTALLHMDYDDGFVAYINGVEVARANMGTANTSVAFDAYAPDNHEAVMSSGSLPDRFDITANVNLFQTGENILAVEVHNVSNTSSDFTAIPFLTIGQTSLTSGSASQYLNLGNLAPHTNFKISSAGETIILSSPDSVVVDSLQSIASLVDVSYGIVDGTSDKKFFLEPTPGYLNGSVGYSMLEDDTVKYSSFGGFITNSAILSLSNDSENSIYFTSNSEDPDESSSLYTQSLTIDSTTTVKARVILPGYLPGKVYSVSFIRDRKPDIPVVSLSTNPDYLWDYNIGMYVMGPNAEGGVPYFGANFWQDWEYPFSFAYFDENGRNLINQEIGVKIFGAWSRANDQKSFALFARKEYGENKIDYPLFKRRSLNAFSSVVLRNSGNDIGNAFMRDGLMTGITAHLGVEYQEFQPTAVYLNGDYWGIYNMREKVNEDYLASHFDLDPDNIIILQNDGEIVEGDNAEYTQLKYYLNANSSLSTTEKYNSVINEIDVDNYIKYQLIQIYVNNTDWPGNNIKFWKSTAPTSKWRWILYDTDFGFGLNQSVDFNTLSFALEAGNGGWPNPDWSTLLFRRMMTNISFRNEFINQMADNINTTFTSKNVANYVDSLANIIDSEMPYHTNRWGRSYDGWKWNVDGLKSFGSSRPSYVRGHIEDYFNLTAQRRITLNASNVSMGKVKINTITPDLPFNGYYFQDVPVTIEALPNPGYKFVHWDGDNTTSDRVLTIDLTKTTTLTAVFEEIDGEDIDLVINEINYNSLAEIDAGDWVEIYNPTNSTFDISGVVLAELNGDVDFVIPNGTVLAAGGYLVIAKNDNKFKSVYPNVLNVISEFPFGLSSAGDEIRLYDKLGNVLDAVDYLPYSPWPEGANGLGYTLELKNPTLDNGQAENWQGNFLGGTPGEANSILTSISESETLTQENEVIVFPSKFTDFVTIQLSVDEMSDVNIDIVDLQGKIVHKISEQGLPGGEYFVDWIPDESIVSGIYFIRVTNNETVVNTRVIYQ